jgi:hypothetical protein
VTIEALTSLTVLTPWPALVFGTLLLCAGPQAPLGAFSAGMTVDP